MPGEGLFSRDERMFRAFQNRDRLVEFLARILQFRRLHRRVAQKTSVVKRVVDAADVIEHLP